MEESDVMRVKKHDVEVDLDELLNNMNKNGCLPDPETYHFWKNYEQRKIYIDISVDATMLEFTRMIHIWNSEDKEIPVEQRVPIRIYLENFGGDGDMMWMMVDAIMASKTPVYTINLGVAGSAASIIFIAGHKRFMMPLAKVVIHEGSAAISGDAVKVLDQSESYKKDLKRMKDFILEHTKIPQRALSKKRNNDWELDAGYCLENGVCDTIVESLDDII